MKITRRKFLGLAASVAILPTGLFGREIASSSGAAARESAQANAAAPKAKIARKLFLDESENDSNSYIVAGCLSVADNLARDVKLRLLKSLGSQSRPRWNRLSKAKLKAHRGMIATAFDAIEKGQLSFDYVISKTGNLRRDAETGYSIAAHKLLFHYPVARHDTHKLYIYPQRRSLMVRSKPIAAG